MNDKTQSSLEDMAKIMKPKKKEKSVRTTFKLPQFIVDYLDEMREDDYPTIDYFDFRFKDTEFNPTFYDYIVDDNNEKGLNITNNLIKKSYAIRKSTLDALNDISKKYNYKRDHVVIHTVAWSYYIQKEYKEKKLKQQIEALKLMESLLSQCYEIERKMDEILDDKDDEVFRSIGIPLIILQNMIDNIKYDLDKGRIVTEEVEWI